MKFAINQRVKFLNDIGGGVVVKYIDDEMVLVRTDDGFEFPHPIKELIADTNQDANSLFVANKNENVQVQQQIPTLEQKIKLDAFEQIKKDNEEVNIYLAVLMDNHQKSQNIEIQLINDSNWHILYTVYFRKDKHFEAYPGSCPANYLEFVETFSIQESYKIKEVAASIIFYRKEPYDFKEPVFKKFEIVPNYFATHKYYVNNDFFEQKAILMPIIEENPLAKAVENLNKSKIQQVITHKEVENDERNRPKVYQSGIKPDLVEIDLHINVLLDDTSNLSPQEMLDYQMKRFEEELKKAQKTQYIKKIVFIHGKGNGKLKFEIRRYLDTHGFKYQDASIQKYGFGATMVFV